MLNEFVEKIVVHERDRKGSIETTQEVEIYFNFIGKYLPPHFGEVEMTSEEIEEMKKREARKDRLPKKAVEKPVKARALTAFNRVVAAAKHLMDVVLKNEGLANKDLAKFESQIQNLADKWDRDDR